MKVKTTRFGEVKIEKEEILSFPEGILGFENLKKFFIVDPGDNTFIMWLQSTEDQSIAFPVIEPKIFKPDHELKLLPSEMNSLQLNSLNESTVYCILTIPQDVTQMSANLKAPIVVNNTLKSAKQIVLQDSKLTVRYEMYKDLKKSLVNYHSDDARRSNLQKSQDQKLDSEAVSGENSQGSLSQSSQKYDNPL